jgi:multiple sugar transport system ATP-binding protein
VGAHRFNLTDQVLAERPGLRAFDGRDIVVGIRPESLEDATLSDGRLPSTIEVLVELREGLGSEVVAHARLDAREPRVETAQKDPDASFSGGEGVEVVARLDPRTQVRIGERATLTVDVERLHFFDEATGLAIRS